LLILLPVLELSFYCTITSPTDEGLIQVAAPSYIARTVPIHFL
jgi:hypothetical protein